MIVVTFFPIQLQDTLMQREEELARLQEENNKLKEFLNSSYVKSLEEKTKVRHFTIYLSENGLMDGQTYLLSGHFKGLVEVHQFFLNSVINYFNVVPNP